MSKFDTIIGLEVHAQLATNSKAFCRCKNLINEKDPEPNSAICPICTGQPGAMPSVNKQAIDWCILVGLALNCDIAELSKFDRKSYWYPDLPKGFQISQYDKPFCTNGYLDIELEGKTKRIRIKRIHLEEDVAKSVHTEDSTLIDFNKSGVPMIELVTDPDMRTPEETVAFLKEYQKILRSLGVSRADMEKGHLRGEGNISVQKKDSWYQGEDGSIKAKKGEKLFPLAEIKNLNSFKSINFALKYESKRRGGAIDKGEELVKETLGWDDLANKTFQMRAKEEAHDYRYFPEPDLPPIKITDIEIKKIKSRLRELPGEKRRRFVEQMGLSKDDAEVLITNPILSDFFGNTVSELEAWDGIENKKAAKLTSNWILSELLGFVEKDELGGSIQRITPENMAELIKMIHKNEINSSAGQEILKVMVEKGGDPSQIAEEKDLTQESDEEELLGVVEKVLDNNSSQVEQYKAGKENLFQFFIGQVMKETKGKADPSVVAKLLKESLNDA